MLYFIIFCLSVTCIFLVYANEKQIKYNKELLKSIKENFQVIQNDIDMLNENETLTNSFSVFTNIQLTHLIMGNLEAIDKITKIKEEETNAIFNDKSLTSKEVITKVNKMTFDLLELSRKLFEEQKYEMLLKEVNSIPKEKLN